MSELGKPSSHFVGREREIEEILVCLSMRRMKSCVLIGKPGVGKTEIAKKALEKASSSGKWRFLSFDSSSFGAGAKFMGMIEERTDAVFKKASKWNKKHPGSQVGFFIDEVHSFWNLGASSMMGTVTPGQAIKPYLADGSITIVGSTTLDEYRSVCLADKALARRLLPVFVEQPEMDETIAMAKSFISNEYPEWKSALPTAFYARLIESGESLCPTLADPDRTIEVLDRTLAKLAFKGKAGSVPEENEIAEAFSSMACLETIKRE